jgi:hypothetical protein
MLMRSQNSLEPYGGELERAIERIQALSRPPTLRSSAKRSEAADDRRKAATTLEAARAEALAIAREEPLIERFGERHPGKRLAAAQAKIRNAESTLRAAIEAASNAEKVEGEEFLAHARELVDEAAPAVIEATRLVHAAWMALLGTFLLANRRGLPTPRLVAAAADASAHVRRLAQIVDQATAPASGE